MSINSIFVVTGFLGTIILAGLLHRMGWRTLYSRKVAHILGGTLASFLPWMVAYPIAICIGLGATVVLFLGLRLGFIPGIADEHRSQMGAWMFPLGFVATAVVAWSRSPWAYAAAGLSVAWADGLAGLFINSSEVDKTRRSSKSMRGSLVVMLVAISVGILVQLGSGSPWSVWLFGRAIIFGVVISLTERLTPGRWDNFTVPVIGSLAALALLRFG